MTAAPHKFWCATQDSSRPCDCTDDEIDIKAMLDAEASPHVDDERTP